MNKFLNKFSNTNNFAETICLSIIFYIVLATMAVLIGLVLTCIYETEAAGIPSVISNMFVWSATLITPIIAILLINSWKSQKSYEVEKEYASLILNDLHPILISLVDIQNIIINIKTVNENLVLYEKYLIPNDKNIRHEAAKSYSNIKIYSEISNNKIILNKHSRLEHHCIRIMDIYDHLINNDYKKYFNEVIAIYPEYTDNEKKPNFCKSYRDNKNFRRSSLRIRSTLYRAINIEVQDPKTKEIFNYGEYKSFEELLEVTRTLLEDIQNEALKSIKVHQ
ncbi:hypothetical protein [Acinetobacter sp. 197]|uniref:hypothetical protein n=1 Tax=Acinetobacter sp. 197 TaxID=3114696 RepID=UPI003A8C2806